MILKSIHSPLPTFTVCHSIGVQECLMTYVFNDDSIIIIVGSTEYLRMLETAQCFKKGEMFMAAIFHVPNRFGTIDGLKKNRAGVCTIYAHLPGTNSHHNFSLKKFM